MWNVDSTKVQVTGPLFAPTCLDCLVQGLLLILPGRAEHSTVSDGPICLKLPPRSGASHVAPCSIPQEGSP